MSIARPLIAASLLLVLIAAAWTWWAFPAKVDMADYVPADSIVYLEFNSVGDLIDAVEQSNAWQATTSITGYASTKSNKALTFLTKAGIGPTDAVILSRAQVALVVVRWNTIEEDSTLRIKPDIALVVETHTSSWRTKALRRRRVTSRELRCVSRGSCGPLLSSA